MHRQRSKIPTEAIRRAKRSHILPVNDLSVRAVNVLQRIGIETVEDLARLSEETLWQTRNCGQKTVREILAWTESLQLALGAGATATSTTVTILRGEHEIKSVEELPVELLLEVSNFNLSTRACRCLKKRRIERVGDLVIQSESALLSGKNLGCKTLNELKEAIASLDLTLGMKVPVWDEIDANALAKHHSTALAKIRRELRKQLYAVDSSAGLETEIASAVATLVKASDQPKMELWLGIDQPVPPTLQQVGEVADVTRERIRQIVLRAQRKLQAARLDMRQLRAAIKCLEKAVVLSDNAAAELLMVEGLAEGQVTARGLLRAAESFGIITKLNGERVDECEFIGLPKGLAVLKSIRPVAQRAVTKWGCSTIDEVTAEINGKVEVAVTRELVSDVLRAQTGFRFLDEETAWFWLENVSRNRLLNSLDKILAVTPQVDLCALRIGVARNRRMEGFSPPTRVLRALCEQLNDCEVVGGNIVVDKRPRLLTEELSHNEQTMLAVFREHGPVLSYSNARLLCINAGINEVTTDIYLRNSPILYRASIGVYTIVGAAVHPGEVAAVAKTIRRTRRSKVIQDYGWKPDGSCVWIIYKLSDAAFRSGVIGVPAGIRRYIAAGGYELLLHDGSRVGHIGIRDSRVWGLHPFFRWRGVETGDYLRISFNLSNATALVETNEEAFTGEER